MPVRFSLRSFFAFAALVAVICAWCVAPSLAARRFARMLAEADYGAADAMFRDARDRCLEKWDDEHWSFRVSGRLAPLTVGQLVTGRRTVQVSIDYFAADQTVSRDGLVVVSPLGAGTPAVGPERFGSMIIDRIDDTSPAFRK